MRTGRSRPPRRRTARKIEFHDTPEHGSWLNMAEPEIALLSRQALDQRLPDADAVRRVLATWERPRNDARATVPWRFTVTDARRKLRRLCPS